MIAADRRALLKGALSLSAVSLLPRAAAADAAPDTLNAHLSGYLTGLRGAAALRRRLLFCDTLAGCLEILDDAGQALAAYPPPPPVSASANAI